MSPSADTIDMFSHFILIAMNPYVNLHLKEFPTFEPNEYFWKTHWDATSGEERWEAYARVMREIVASGHNFALSNLAMEDKLYYKKLIKGHTDTKKTL